MESTRLITRINDVDIFLIDNEEKLVPIRPICDALGVDYKSQYQKLKDDETLAPTMALVTKVAADNKMREMVCIPYMYVLGWLFTINPKNVKPEARQEVTRKKIECYKALYYFYEKTYNSKVK